MATICIAVCGLFFFARPFYHEYDKERTHMKYENAQDLLPEALLIQVQKYISGKLVYIPAREHHREWGSVSGARQTLQERNRKIRERFAFGQTIEELAESNHLSCESIKRIVYNRKESILMTYRCALSSAREWAKAGRLEDWVHAYLLSDGHNKPFSDGLKIVDRMFLGPVSMPLSLLHRCCGPEEGMPYRVDPRWWEAHVQRLQTAIQNDPDMPPLIVHYLIPEGKSEGEFELNDGNTRFEAYTRLGISEANAIVWITDRYEYEQFLERFGRVLLVEGTLV